MPNSLKCKIKHLCHNRTITESECDRILKALEQESILDNIRAEIEARLCDVVSDYTDGYRTAIQGVLAIIDKYREGGAG